MLQQQEKKIYRLICLNLNIVVYVFLDGHSVLNLICYLEGETSQVILLGNLENSKSKHLIDREMYVNEDGDGEMHCFNLETIEVATNNFSNANKLGEGGFGPVYKVREIGYEKQEMLFKLELWLKEFIMEVAIP